MAAAQPLEAKELALVGKVEMRIALADSEKKLEDLLRVYLAPLLLKLGSEYVAVRNKVNILTFFSFVTFSFLLVQRTPLIAVFTLGYLYMPAHQHPHQITVRPKHQELGA